MTISQLDGFRAAAPAREHGGLGGQATGVVPHVSRIAPPFRPILEVDPAYSELPIEQGFNWVDAFALVDDGDWYLVAFRSKHADGVDDAYLTWLDERASGAASQHPGFMYYFIGTPRPDGHCLSFCLWKSRPDAVAAAADPEHRAAMELGLPFFAHYRLERYQILKRDGSLRFLPLEASASGQRGHAA
ncbi:MAG: hypothetical protein QM692_13220 [Thermomicrobiales bacterium]